MKDIFHDGHSAAKAVKPVKMSDFERNAVKAIKVFMGKSIQE